MSTTTFDRVRKLIVEQLCVDPDRVTLASRFAEDLCADSLDRVCLTLEAEAEFGIDIPNREADETLTVQQLVDLVNRKTAAVLAQKAGGTR